MGKKSLTNRTGQGQLVPRVAAAQVLVAVLWQGRLLDHALEEVAKQLAPSERPLVQEMCYGSMRWLWQLQALLAQLLHKPLRERDRDIQTLILLGLYQLRYMRVQPYAAVNETVKAATSLSKPWAKKLINACLRGYQQRQQELEAKLVQDTEAQYNHPQWLLQQWQLAWPQQWQAMVEANNARPPMSLRVNLSRETRADYLEQLRQAEIAATTCALSDSGVILASPLAVHDLPGFAQGLVSVQDCAAQMAAKLLDAQPGERILDACAAPGGKTSHILERCPKVGELVAVDVEPLRITRIEQNLERLGQHATLVRADLSQSSQWWDGKHFDRILLDAPCSATGVIRRHPDIKWHRRPEQLATIVATQAQILEHLWPLLAPGGKLLYATCSVLPQENNEQITTFLGRHSDAHTTDLGIATVQDAHTPGWQILPGDNNMDGFYYACITKAA